MESCIYLDNAATTFPKPQPVIDAVMTAMKEYSVNAGRGVYDRARIALKVIDECRHRILTLAGLSSGYGVILTPSATIALNQIIFGIETSINSNIYVTPFEHNSVLRAVHELCARIGCKMHVLPFNKVTWELDFNFCESLFAANPPTAVFASLVSNVTGFELPIDMLSEITHSYDGIFVVDASQAFGAIKYNYRAVDADAYVFAGHKTLYGPFGIGGMIIKPSILHTPLIFGGTGSDSQNLEMPSEWPVRYEASSQNIISIAGLNAGIQWVNNIGQELIQANEKKLLNKLIDSLREIDNIDLYVPLEETKQHGILALNIDGIVCSDVASILNDEYRIAVRSGYHCAGLFGEWCNISHLYGCLRVSVGYFNTMEDIKAISHALSEIACEVLL